jgi:hypothetical protein
MAVPTRELWGHYASNTAPEVKLTRRLYADGTFGSGLFEPAGSRAHDRIGG